jgi:hypothetical protein
LKAGEVLYIVSFIVCSRVDDGDMYDSFLLALTFWCLHLCVLPPFALLILIFVYYFSRVFGSTTLSACKNRRNAMSVRELDMMEVVNLVAMKTWWNALIKKPHDCLPGSISSLLSRASRISSS